MIGEPEELLGFKCEGVHFIVRWAFACNRGPTLVIARSSMRGRPWIRAVRRIGSRGWWITAHQTKREALAL